MNYPQDYPRHGFHVCHGCGSMAPHHSQMNYPDNGWVFDMSLLGYYGGFTDMPENREEIRFCHDCVIKFLETFPLLSLFIGAGAHSQQGPDEKPCCKYAFKTEIIGDIHITSIAEENGESWTVYDTNKT